MNNLIAVFIGGGLGSIARLGISLIIYERFKTVFPLATLISNTLSCFILALAILLLGVKLNLNVPLRMLLLTGFCGGFSTFSTFSFETIELIRSGNIWYAVANILLNVALCLGVILFVVKNQ